MFHHVCICDVVMIAKDIMTLSDTLCRGIGYFWTGEWGCKNRSEEREEGEDGETHVEIFFAIGGGNTLGPIGVQENETQTYKKLKPQDKKREYFPTIRYFNLSRKPLRRHVTDNICFEDSQNFEADARTETSAPSLQEWKFLSLNLNQVSSLDNWFASDIASY